MSVSDYNNLTINNDTLKILNSIKNTDERYYDFSDITLNDLLTLDETGVTYLDYICQKVLFIPYKIIYLDSTIILGKYQG